MAVDLGRAVDFVHTAVQMLEGGGFPVRRPFPTAGLEMFDPFLLLDEMGPVDWSPGAAIGAPDHPHRGFETVTYVLDGEVEHRDSQGHSAVLGPGDVQWMTAGSGVIHSELPTEDFLQRGGRMHGFQLWVNLPRDHKMIPPRYQDLPASRTPVAHTDDGRVAVRVIAGSSLGVTAAIDTHTAILVIDVTIQPGGSLVQGVPSDHRVFVFVFEGEGAFGSQLRTAGQGQMVAFAGLEPHIAISVPEDAPRPLRALIVGGVPIGEPVARYGPFVMNTRSEILQAISDYQQGRFGTIAP